MKSFNLKVADSHNLTVIPDAEAHMDGHPALTYSYSIYQNEGENSAERLNFRESNLHLDIQSPDYMGVILFDSPTQMFTYMPGEQQLPDNEVQEIIAHINHYRNAPGMWLI